MQTSLDRRKLLVGSALGGAAALIAFGGGVAKAQSSPELQQKPVTSAPKRIVFVVRIRPNR